MKTKIKQILLDTLTSAYDEGNIDNGGIYGGNNAVDKLYDLFVDEVTSLNELNGIILSRTVELKDRPTCDIDKCDHPEEWRTHYEGGSSWCRKCWSYVFIPKLPEEKKKKISDLLYTNPKTKKAQKLFDTLNPVYTVRYINPTCGYKGEALYLTVEANSEEEAKDLAMENKKFVGHIYMKYYDKKYLDAYKPIGNYVIGRVDYYEGDPRL